MRSRSWKTALAGLAALALCGVLRAEGFSSAHWKSKSDITGGPQGDMSTESELWTKDKKIRVKTKAMGMDMNVIRSGDMVYQWQDGQSQGMKMSASMRRRGGASMDYVDKIEEVRTKGKKIGTETVDSHACDIYEYSETNGDRTTKQKYWLATDLKNFPVKVVTETGGMTITTTNREIELNASVADSLLAVPENVKFQDMSEMMKGMMPKN